MYFLCQSCEGGPYLLYQWLFVALRFPTVGITDAHGRLAQDKNELYNQCMNGCYGSYNPKMIITSSQGYETIIDHHAPNNSQKGYLANRKGWGVYSLLWVVSAGWMNGCSWSETLFPFRWCHIILIPDDTLHTTRSIPGNVQEIDEILC